MAKLRVEDHDHGEGRVHGEDDVNDMACGSARTAERDADALAYEAEYDRGMARRDRVH